jgi:purine-binding chemotaxis protein CheW
MTAQPLGLDEIQAMLKERARELARPVTTADDGDLLEMAILECGSERFAIDVSRLREVRAAPTITRVPSLPPVWLGLMNLRGELCPVLDLSRYLGAGSQAEAGRHDVAVVQNVGRVIGLRVDGIVEVRRMRKTDVGPSISGTSGVIEGVTVDLTSVIDVEALVADPNLVVKDGAA